MFVSRRVHSAPLALASDGTLLINISHYIGIVEPEKLLEMAMADNGRTFIGVTLNPAEVQLVRERAEHGLTEAAAYALGARTKTKVSKW